MFSKGNWIIQPTSKNIGGLMLSGINYAKDRKNLQNDNIKAAISLYVPSYYNPQIKFPTELNINHKFIKIDDDPESFIKPEFKACCEFINSNIKCGNVLVHCQAGVSRSATIAIAYIMYKQRMKFKQALQLVKQKRQQIDPNQGFLQQLNSWQLQLRL